MDVRSIEDVEPVVEHNGTVPVWWLVNPREMFDITKGGHLELVSEFEVAGGGFVDPHNHPTHEFYYVTAGRGIMTIEGEEREIRQGDLVHIPPNAVHSPAAGERPRADPLLLLRGRRRRRGRGQLHRALTAWVGCWSPAVFPTAGWIRSPGHELVGPNADDAPFTPTSCARTRATSTRSCALLTDRIDADVLAAGAAAGLKVVANVAVGYDNIDVGAARRARHRRVQHARRARRDAPPTSRSC